MTTDPVCFLSVDEQLAADQGLVTEQHGRAFYFCSEECKRQFDLDPAQYIGPDVGPDLIDRDSDADYAG